MDSGENECGWCRSASDGDSVWCKDTNDILRVDTFHVFNALTSTLCFPCCSTYPSALHCFTVGSSVGVFELSIPSFIFPVLAWSITSSK